MYTYLATFRFLFVFWNCKRQQLQHNSRKLRQFVCSVDHCEVITQLMTLLVDCRVASFPDVMLPAYNYSRWSAMFFIMYLTVELYFLMNIVRIAINNNKYNNKLKRINKRIKLV